MTGNLLQRFYTEVVTDGNFDLIDELVSDDFLDHEEGLPGQPPGKDGGRFFAQAIRAAFPDVTVKVSGPALSDGDLQAANIVMTGTHRGEFMGIAPTGRTVEFGSTDIIRLQDGKIIEHWGTTDTMTLMQQLGAIPT